MIVRNYFSGIVCLKLDLIATQIKRGSSLKICDLIQTFLLHLTFLTHISHLWNRQLEKKYWFFEVAYKNLFLFHK